MPLRLVLDLDGRRVKQTIGESPRVVGSAPECDLRIAHFTVSRRHARLTPDPDGVRVEDLGSSNGTRIDGRPIDEPTVARAGQRVSFGSVEGRVEEVAEEELDPGITLPAGESPPAPSPKAKLDEEAAGPSRTTFSLGSLKSFVLADLPDLVTALARGAGSAEMAQRVGAALYQSLPCAWVEIVDEGVDGEAGLHFSARAEREPSEEAVVEAPIAGALRLRVGFLHGDHADSFRRLVQSAALMSGLTTRSGRQPRPRISAPEGPPPLPDPPTVVGSVRRIYTDAARVAPSTISVLIVGESGVGKEVLARYLHAASGRPEKSFVALNCAALPRDLLEAELFGVEKGAATGVAARPGKFELAHRGTLFLDEIGDMAPETQAKILRALQEGEIFRLGAKEPRPAEARVVSATNRDVEALVAAGTLRSDLYHRIGDWVVPLPPLRARRADITNLAAHFLQRQAAARGVRPAGISRAAVAALETYPWPGNIRQLEREMARAALFVEEGELLETGHLLPEIASGRPPERRSLKEVLEAAERAEIERAMAECGGDTRAAARLLGLGRSTLYRRLKALGLEPSG